MKNDEDTIIKEHKSPSLETYSNKSIKDQNRDVVLNVVKTLDNQKLEKVLFKIDASILLTKDEITVALLRTIRDVIVEVMP